MAKKKFSTWNAEEWLYTEFLMCGGPLSKEWVKKAFTQRRYLHGGNPEIILEVCLQKLGIREEGIFFCPPT